MNMSTTKKNNVQTHRARSATTVPAAISYRGHSRHPESQVLRNRTLFHEVYSEGAGSPVAFNINPGLHELFPWVADQAPLFQQYKIRKLHFEWVPACGTDTTGAVYLSWDRDPEDLVPTTAQDLMMRQTSGSSTLWDSYTLRLPTTSEALYNRTATTEIKGSRKFYDYGTFVFLLSQNSGEGKLGDLYVSYEIELLRPTTPADNPTSPGIILASQPTSIAALPSLPTYPTAINSVDALRPNGVVYGRGASADVPVLHNRLARGASPVVLEWGQYPTGGVPGATPYSAITCRFLETGTFTIRGVANQAGSSDGIMTYYPEAGVPWVVQPDANSAAYGPSAGSFMSSEVFCVSNSRGWVPTTPVGGLLASITVSRPDGSSTLTSERRAQLLAAGFKQEHFDSIAVGTIAMIAGEVLYILPKLINAGVAIANSLIEINRARKARPPTDAQWSDIQKNLRPETWAQIKGGLWHPDQVESAADTVPAVSGLELDDNEEDSADREDSGAAGPDDTAARRPYRR